MPDRNTFVISVSHVDNHLSRQAVTPGVTTDGHTVHAVMQVPHPGARARRGKGVTPILQTECRSWSVMPGPGLEEYQVTDYGPKGIEAARDGAVVWSGKRTKAGYSTASTTITAPEQLAKLLNCIAAGDEGRQEAEGTPAPTAKKPKRGGRKAKAKEPPPETSAKSKPAAGGGGRRPGRRAAAEVPVAKGDPASRPRRSRRAEPAPPTQRNTPSASSADRPGKRRGRGRRKAAAPAPTSGERVTIQLPDDETVLAGVRAKVAMKVKDAAKAEQLFGVLRRIWLAGGREKTIVWMQAHGVKNAVDAFDAWVNTHMEEAKAMLG